MNNLDSEKLEQLLNTMHKAGRDSTTVAIKASIVQLIAEADSKIQLATGKAERTYMGEYWGTYKRGLQDAIKVVDTIAEEFDREHNHRKP